MGEKRYIISDASKMLGVESHVLRYWEEELNVVIPRNEMGHRYYTDNHINLLKNVRDLKNQGYSLRTIKMMLTDPDVRDGEGQNARAGMSMPLTAREVSAPVMQQSVRVENASMVSGYNDMAGKGVAEQGTSGSKMEQFQAIMNKVVCKALKESASELGKEVSGNVSETVLKEMNYLIRTQDEREEERFKKLDEAMRSKQKMSRKDKKKQVKAEKLLLKKTKKQEQKEKQEKQKKAAAEKKKQELHIGKKVVTE
ncbi:MAG: MerR family transcriptional regulator [Eubacterium sp.]|jgi:DNA-binding transcriptional MerR regulator|nr:MerR family transcriptional regulator [Eubacterium sp.]